MPLEMTVLQMAHIQGEKLDRHSRTLAAVPYPLKKPRNRDRGFFSAADIGKYTHISDGKHAFLTC